MSGSGAGESADRRAFLRLERVVEGLLEELERLRKRAGKSQARVRDVEALLRRFTKGEDDPARLLDRISELELENDDLKERILAGREGVERLLARIRFLEERS